MEQTKPLPRVPNLPTPRTSTRPGKRLPPPPDDAEQAGPVRLNLGAGRAPIEGYINLDRKMGQEAYPLDYPDNSVDEIRASHLLEHFGHQQTVHVVTDWARALKPGGLMKLAVPDFDYIATQYIGGTTGEPLESFVMGGQEDNADIHLAIFNRDKLHAVMQTAGLVDIQPWKPDVRDCSSLPVSLNLQGSKPRVPPKPLKVGAVMSAPRLGFMDNFFCVFEALLPLKVYLRKTTGAYWGQCLERAMEMAIADGVEAILTLDYDTIFSKQHVAQLIYQMATHPEVDAVTSLQPNRSRPVPLMTIRDSETGGNTCELPREAFDPDLLKIQTGHFGLTLLRVSSLLKMPHPWFIPEPDPDGNWGEARKDEDINFWRKWEAAGNSLYVANRVPVGHAELIIKWLSTDFTIINQLPSEFAETGPPPNVWR